MQDLIVVVFGASGDLAKKKTFPALYHLYRDGWIQKENRLSIIGYARTSMTQDEFRDHLEPFLSTGRDHAFYDALSYQPGSYEDLSSLASHIQSLETASTLKVFYLALPPHVFLTVLKQIHANFRSNIRIIIEKPFGHDLVSSNQLAAAISPLFSENQIYRIDHYLGKEMVKNLFVLRFANLLFRDVWNSRVIDNVQITFKETIGIDGRGKYFDGSGIVRDVFQNHLLQLLSIVAMEPPRSLKPEDIRASKVQALRHVRKISPRPGDHDEELVVLGQYEGYLSEPDVDPRSKTPTFAAAVLYVDNERWHNVPFILKCGKALDKRKAEIRIQFKDVPRPLLFDQDQIARNELVVKIQPDEAVYLKFMVKRPGLTESSFSPVISDLDLSMKEKFSSVRIPEAYETLLLDVFQGDQSHFVHSEELQAAWQIVDPLLNPASFPLHIYPKNTRGPQRADWLLLERGGYLQSNIPYVWPNK